MTRYIITLIICILTWSLVAVMIYDYGRTLETRLAEQSRV